MRSRCALAVVARIRAPSRRTLEARQSSSGSRDGQALADEVEAHPRHPLEEPRAVRGQGALDDAPVVRAVAPLDEPVALDAGDEAGRGGRTEVEDLGDPAHRLRALAKEQEQEPDLAEGQVPGGERRDVARR